MWLIHHFENQTCFINTLPHLSCTSFLFFFLLRLCPGKKKLKIKRRVARWASVSIQSAPLSNAKHNTRNTHTRNPFFSNTSSRFDQRVDLKAFTFDLANEAAAREGWDPVKRYHFMLQRHETVQVPPSKQRKVKKKRREEKDSNPSNLNIYKPSIYSTTWWWYSASFFPIFHHPSSGHLSRQKVKIATGTNKSTNTHTHIHQHSSGAIQTMNACKNKIFMESIEIDL